VERVAVQDGDEAVTTWDTPLRKVLGKDAAKLAKGLGVETVGQLVSHYPRRLLRAGEATSLGELEPGARANVVVTVRQVTVHDYMNRRTNRLAHRVEVEAALADGTVWMTFFDSNRGRATWRAQQLSPGTTLLAAGKFEKNTYKRGRWELAHPYYEVGETATLPALMPIYPATSEVTSPQVMRAMRVALDVLGEVPDPLPEEVRLQRDLPTLRTALEWMHRPETQEQHLAARRRLKLDEALVMQVALAQRRREQRALTAVSRKGRQGGLLDAFGQQMPFELTAGQRDVEQVLMTDLAGEHPMHRLLQGEVGSGKTVVALRAMLRVVDSGGQAVLLAPTEVLAQQHHRSISAMLGDLAGGDMLGAADQATGVALLTGSTGAPARRQALLDAASGHAGIVIGTHALLEDVVQFADLGLVVVDEQHRFGVEQRAALAAKAAGGAPHVLVMTATPIPRTVAMTVFGDLETSELRELPRGRAPIQTTVVPVAAQPTWLDRAWSRVREEVAAGRQAYVVCPRISADEDEGDQPPWDAPEDGTARVLAAVDQVAPMLTGGPLDGLRVTALHGRMHPDDKDRTMRAFAAGEVDVLVSTTVVEVGVDVPNATMMVILDADRFGISQLHQLRGRVGRGAHPGLCLLVTTAAGASARRRLEAVAGTVDGFRLAELDLEIRREGDVLGADQSGRRSSLQLLSVVRDIEVVQDARTLAGEIVATDPTLSGHPVLARRVLTLREGESAAYLEKT
jgi:ATP-dependent DNA helicase RecG